MGRGRVDVIEPVADHGPGQVVPSRLTLFLTFAQIGITGFGGVGPWARRVIVEERRWLDDRQYAEVLSLCQVLPGPNVGNVSVMIGDRFHGAVGAVLALTGLMSGPMLILLALGLLYEGLGSIPLVDGAISGVASAAAGLFIGTARKVAEKLRLSVAGLAIVAAASVAVGLLRWPLLWVMLALGPLSIALAWRKGW